MKTINFIIQNLLGYMVKMKQQQYVLIGLECRILFLFIDKLIEMVIKKILFFFHFPNKLTILLPFPENSF